MKFPKEIFDLILEKDSFYFKKNLYFFIKGKLNHLLKHRIDNGVFELQFDGATSYYYKYKKFSIFIHSYLLETEPKIITLRFFNDFNCIVVNS